MKKLITYKEFSELTKPISASEYERLEQNILKFGCRHAIKTWGDVIIDGHKRYAICQKHNIPFTVDDMDFRSFAEAKQWARRHADFVAECREMLADVFEDDKPEKPVSKPMLVLPPTPVGRFRTIWNIDAMTPADINEFVIGIHQRYGKNFLKEFIFVLFAHFVPRQDTEARRHLFQQLYNLHYTPTFTER